jgi:hypothetical protein
MTYFPGESVSLTHLNKEVAKPASKKSITEKVFTAIQVNEEKYIFKTARLIPVQAV